MNAKKFPKNLLLIGFVLCLAAMSLGSTWREEVIALLGSKPSWTVMLYLDGDEISMEQDFIAAFKDMAEAEAGSSSKVSEKTALGCQQSMSAKSALWQRQLKTLQPLLLKDRQMT